MTNDDAQTIRLIDARNGWQQSYQCPDCGHELGSEPEDSCGNCTLARRFALWQIQVLEHWTASAIANRDGYDGTEQFETHSTGDTGER